MVTSINFHTLIFVKLIFPTMSKTQGILEVNQYMGNACKQLFFGLALYPSIMCYVCNSP
jgi:hypothetical protein